MIGVTSGYDAAASTLSTNVQPLAWCHAPLIVCFLLCLMLDDTDMTCFAIDDLIPIDGGCPWLALMMYTGRRQLA